MNVIYDKNDGNIIKILSSDQNYKTYFKLFSQEFQDTLECLFSDEIPDDFKSYRIINNEFVKILELELEEIRIYGKVLTQEERLLNQLKPSHEKIKKAETTIEILSLLQEVLW